MITRTKVDSPIECVYRQASGFERTRNIGRFLDCCKLKHMLNQLSLLRP